MDEPALEKPNKGKIVAASLALLWNAVVLLIHAEVEYLEYQVAESVHSVRRKVDDILREKRAREKVKKARRAKEGNK